MTGATNTQMRAWALLRDAPAPMVGSELGRGVGRAAATVQPWLVEWTRQGHLLQIGTGPRATFEMKGPARRLRQTPDPAPTGELDCADNAEIIQHLWNAARAMRSGWTADNLRSHSPLAAQITDETLRGFVNLLQRSGYAKRIARGHPGRRADLYRLIRDTGPLPPQERRVRLTYDPNLREVTHLPEVTS
ncbi:MAG: hypothetical protein AAFY65_10865 [Pseudomonadota bacterium]